MHVRPIERVAFIIVIVLTLLTVATLALRKSPLTALAGLQGDQTSAPATAASAFSVESGPDRVGQAHLWVVIHNESRTRFIYIRDEMVHRFALVPLDRKSSSPSTP